MERVVGRLQFEKLVGVPVSQESAVTSMVRVCCACGAQDKALKLVAESQVPPALGWPGGGQMELGHCHSECTLEG